MDSFSNVLEGARQYFQGLPSPAGSSSYQAPQGSSSVTEAAISNSPRYSNPDTGTVGSTAHYDSVGHRPSVVATNSQQPATPSALPPHSQPHHHQQQNATTIASSISSTVVSYWPPVSTNSIYQRTKDVSVSHPGPPPSQTQHPYAPSKVPAVSSASQSASHTVYNGSRLAVPEPRTVNYQHQNHMQQQPRPQGHNLPPIAALPNYHSSRSARESLQRVGQHHSQSQHHMSSNAVQAPHISNKMPVSNPTTLIRTQTEYAPQSQQNNTIQYTGASNSSVAVGNGSAGTLQYGIHRGPKYQQQQLVPTPPTSTAYNSYNSPRMPQQQAASTTSISSSSSASSSSSGYHPSSLHHSQQQQQQPQQQQQQQYAYHPHPHHTQGGLSHSTHTELHLKPDQHQQTHPSKHQFPAQVIHFDRCIRSLTPKLYFSTLGCQN